MEELEIKQHNFDCNASALLGEYDTEGNYVVEQKIIDELLKAYKIIDFYSEWLVKATAEVDVYKLNFEITIEDGENNKKRATLYLIEKGQLGYVDVVKTKIIDHIFDNNNLFYIELKRVFNLLTAEDVEGKDTKNLNLKETISKKNLKKNKYKGLIGQSRELDQKYLLSLLKLLGEFDLGKQILQEFKTLLKANGTAKIEASYYREATKILNKLLIKNKPQFNKEMLEKINTIQKDYFSSYEKLKLSEPEKKSEVILMPSSNKGNDKKGDGKKKDSGKGSDKKGDDKKKDSANKKGEADSKTKKESIKTSNNNQTAASEGNNTNVSKYGERGLDREIYELYSKKRTADKSL